MSSTETTYHHDDPETGIQIFTEDGETRIVLTGEQEIDDLTIAKAITVAGFNPSSAVGNGADWNVDAYGQGWTVLSA